MQNIIWPRFAHSVLGRTHDMTKLFSKRPSPGLNSAVVDKTGVVELEFVLERKGPCHHQEWSTGCGDENCIGKSHDNLARQQTATLGSTQENSKLEALCFPSLQTYRVSLKLKNVSIEKVEWTCPTQPYTLWSFRIAICVAVNRSIRP